MLSAIFAEPTVQHEETPQPPPENPPEGMDEEVPPPGPEEQQNAEIIFFTSFDAHFGQFCVITGSTDGLKQ